jgi:hypothetical protein
MHAAAGKHAPAAVARFAATQWLPIQVVRVPVQVTRQLRVAAADMLAAVECAAVVECAAAVVVECAVAVAVDMPAAVDIGNL